MDRHHVLSVTELEEKSEWRAAQDEVWATVGGSEGRVGWWGADKNKFGGEEGVGNGGWGWGRFGGGGQVAGKG